MAAEQHTAPTLSGATVPHQIIVLTNRAADALDELKDIHHLLSALSLTSLDLDPRALTPVSDCFRDRLRNALEALESARAAMGGRAAREREWV